jgi:hypothetical protein
MSNSDPSNGGFMYVDDPEDPRGWGYCRQLEHLAGAEPTNVNMRADGMSKHPFTGDLLDIHGEPLRRVQTYGHYSYLGTTPKGPDSTWMR